MIVQQVCENGVGPARHVGAREEAFEGVVSSKKFCKSGPRIAVESVGEICGVGIPCSNTRTASKTTWEIDKIVFFDMPVSVLLPYSWYYNFNAHLNHSMGEYFYTMNTIRLVKL